MSVTQLPVPPGATSRPEACLAIMLLLACSPVLSNTTIAMLAPLLRVPFGPPGLSIVAALGVGQSLANSLSRPSCMATVGELSDERRGVVMGLNALANESGMVLGSAPGGLALALGGYHMIAGPVVAWAALAVAIGVPGLDDESGGRHA